MQKSILFTCGLVTLLGSAMARVSFGSCPNPVLQANFDMWEFFGVWYEVKRDSFKLVEDGDCVYANFTSNLDGSVNIRNSKLPASGYRYETDESATPKIDSAAHYDVKESDFNPNAEFRIVSTDYENYAVVYACSPLPLMFKNDDVWIYTRKSNNTEEFIESLVAIAKAKIPTYDVNALYNVRQGGNCTYGT